MRSGAGHPFHKWGRTDLPVGAAFANFEILDRFATGGADLESSLCSRWGLPIIELSFWLDLGNLITIFCLLARQSIELGKPA